MSITCSPQLASALGALLLLVLLGVPAIASAQPACAALPAPSGAVIDVTPGQAGALPGIVNNARAGDTIRLADGTYALTQTLVFRTSGVTMRSATGNRDGVVIDGHYGVGDLLLLYASNVTIADLTLTRAYHHPVHVVPALGPSSGTLLHNLRVVDGGAQFIKVNPANGYYADNGVVRCSALELTDAGRTQVRNNCYTGGIDAHQARGWQVSGNRFDGFWCAAGLSEHAIHFWTGSRDTVIEGNVVVNSARGIGLGLGDARAGRSYADQPCGGKTAIGHYGGSVTNNFVVVTDDRVFDSAAGFDTGVGLEQSCESNVLHNTVVSTRPPRSSSIEWRFAHTRAVIANNLTTHALRARDGGLATLAGNVSAAPLGWFADAARGDLHLTPAAGGAIDRAAPTSPPVAWDIDRERRESAPDVGADEYAAAAFTLAATTAVAAGDPIEVVWSAPPDRATAADRIGLFATGAADTAALAEQFTGGSPAGTVYFTAPPAAGSYELRYFTGNPTTRVAVSNEVIVKPAVDTTPPTVRITSPAEGGRARKTIQVTVAVADDRAVVRVELYVDGVLADTSASAPFTTTWNAQAAPRGAHTLQVRAYDAAGNVGNSVAVTVQR